MQQEVSFPGLELDRNVGEFGDEGGNRLDGAAVELLRRLGLPIIAKLGKRRAVRLLLGDEVAERLVRRPGSVADVNRTSHAAILARMAPAACWMPWMMPPAAGCWAAGAA